MNRTRRAFSLIELVIVVVIIGIIAAIAVPRMSRGATGAADGALVANLALMRNAMEIFQTEHGGSSPSLANYVNAMTQYSDEAGTTFSATKSTSCVYGPYLRAIPPLPVGADRGKTSVIGVYTAGNGWVYDAAAASIKANCPDAETDAAGKKYNTY